MRFSWMICSSLRGSALFSTYYNTVKLLQKQIWFAISQPNSTGSYIISCGHWAIYRCLIPVEAQSCWRSEWIRHLHLLLLVVMVLSAVPCRRVFFRVTMAIHLGNLKIPPESTFQIDQGFKEGWHGNIHQWKHIMPKPPVFLSGFLFFKQVNSCNYLPIYLVSWLEEAKTAIDVSVPLGLDVDVARIGKGD